MLELIQFIIKSKFSLSFSYQFTWYFTSIPNSMMIIRLNWEKIIKLFKNGRLAKSMPWLNPEIRSNRIWNYILELRLDKRRTQTTIGIKSASPKIVRKIWIITGHILYNFASPIHIKIWYWKQRKSKRFIKSTTETRKSMNNHNWLSTIICTIERCRIE